MVRTKGFCRALGRVLGKALGRQVSDDEEVTQRQRPTTLTRRQRAIVVVAEDIEHMDHAADEAHEEHHDPVTDDVGVDSQEFHVSPPWFERYVPDEVICSQ